MIDQMREAIYRAALDQIPSESPQDVSSAVQSRSTADALRAFERRLAEAQRELSVQFTRIEQLQADLDLSVETLRRARDDASRPEASLRSSG